MWVSVVVSSHFTQFALPKDTHVTMCLSLSTHKHTSRAELRARRAPTRRVSKGGSIFIMSAVDVLRIYSTRYTTRTRPTGAPVRVATRFPDSRFSVRRPPTPTWEACWAGGVGEKSLRRSLQSIRVLQTHTGEAEEPPTHDTTSHSTSATCEATPSSAEL